jgi:cellobiose-specific phosphotransferase system component IIC
LHNKGIHELIHFVFIWPFPSTFISSFCCIIEFLPHLLPSELWNWYFRNIFTYEFVLYLRQINYAEFVGNSVLFVFFGPLCNESSVVFDCCVTMGCSGHKDMQHFN